MSKVKTNFLTPIEDEDYEGSHYIERDQIQEECRDRWRKSSWTSAQIAKHPEARRLDYLERLQFLLTHGSKSERDANSAR